MHSTFDGDVDKDGEFILPFNYVGPQSVSFEGLEDQ